MTPSRSSTLCLALLAVGALVAVGLASVAGHVLATGISYLANEVIGNGEPDPAEARESGGPEDE